MLTKLVLFEGESTVFERPAGKAARQPTLLAKSVTQSKPLAPAPAPGKRFLEAFGDQGAVWFAEGKTYDEAHKLYAESLKAKNKAQDAKITELRSQLAALDDGSCRAKFEASRPPVPPELRNAFGPATGLARFATGIKFAKPETAIVE